jgi:hypothetical protein
MPRNQNVEHQEKFYSVINVFGLLEATYDVEHQNQVKL